MARVGARLLGRNALFEALDERLARLLTAVDPKTGRTADATADDLNAHCYALALLEQGYRNLFAAMRGPLGSLARDATVDDLIGLVPERALDDLSQLIDGFSVSMRQALLEASVVVLNPTFPGSADLKADGDLIADGCLIELKTTAEAHRLSYATIYQLVGYVLLDYGDVHAMRDVAFYTARRPALLAWNCDALLAELAGIRITREELRTEFRAVLADLNAGTSVER